MNRDMIEERGKPFHKKKLLMLLFMLFIIVIGIGAYFIDNDQKGNDIGVGKWVYNITYELNGSILLENAPKTYDNRKETALVNPTKEGYTFKGWTGSNGATPQKDVTITKGTSGDKTYAAKWKANISTVTFNGNGADSGSIPSMTMTYDQSKTLPKNSFTKKGYKFSGWSTNQYGTGTNFNDEQIVKNLTTVNNGTVVLYAQWTKTNQKIIVNPNNGEDKYTLSGSYYKTFKVDIPKRTGYTFNGWTQSQNSGDIGIENKTVDFNNPNIISEGKIKPYVYYTKIPDNSTSEYGQLTMVEASQDNPTNNKYEIKITSNKEFIDDKGIRTYFGFHMDTSETHDKEKYYYHTFKAKLPKGTKLKYCYNTLGDNGGITWLTSNYGTGEWEDYTYKAYAGKNSNGSVIGYVIVESIDKQKVLTPFDWYLAESKIIKSEKSPNTNILMVGSEDYEVTAQWSPNTYTIKLHGNGGGLVEGKTNTIQATYDQNITIPDGVFNKSIVTLLNYNTISDGSGKTYNIGDSVKNLTNENNGTVYLYAQWNSAIDFNSIYHKGRLGNSYNDGENVKSFYYKITKSDGSVIEKAVTNGDLVYNGIKQGDIVEIKFIDYRFGYQFTNFLIINNTGSNSIIGNGVTLLSQDETNIKFRVDKTYSDTRSTITLSWYNKEIPYSLSYNLYGGTLFNGATNPTGYNVRSENIILNNPTKVGYTFEGWEEILRPTQWHKGDLKNVQGDPFGGAPCETSRGAYYSDFVSVKANNRYKCNTYDMGTFGARYYDKNFNYVAYITDALNDGYTAPQDGYIRFVIPLYEKYKDTILPHVKLTNMTLQKEITIEKGSVGNREYIAKWTPITWTVQYDANGGNGTMEDSFHIFDGYNKLNKNIFSRNGYNFNGWHLSRVNNGKTEWLYANADGSYINANQWHEIGKQPNGQVLYKLGDQQVFQHANLLNNAIITAHAQWKEIPYNIIYNLDGGTLPSDVPKTYYSSQGLDTLPIPIKDNKFLGWTYTDLTKIETTLNNGGPNNEYEVEFLEDVIFQYYIDGKRVPKDISIYNSKGECVFYDSAPERSKSGVFNIPAGKYKINTFEVMTWNINIEPKKYITSIPKGTIGDITLNAMWMNSGSTGGGTN